MAPKPREVLASQARSRVKRKRGNRRRNAAFVRQGEWFLVPTPGFARSDGFVRNEPIQRGRSKPHVVEELHRRDGRPVYVAAGHPRLLSPGEHARLLAERPEMRRLSWRFMRNEPEAYGRGRVRHPDHGPVVLPFWHRIVPNAEVSKGPAGGGNLFPD